MIKEAFVMNMIFMNGRQKWMNLFPSLNNAHTWSSVRVGTKISWRRAVSTGRKTSYSTRDNVCQWPEQPQEKDHQWRIRLFLVFQLQSLGSVLTKMRVTGYHIIYSNHMENNGVCNEFISSIDSYSYSPRTVK